MPIVLSAMKFSGWQKEQLPPILYSQLCVPWLNLFAGANGRLSNKQASFQRYKAWRSSSFWDSSPTLMLASLLLTKILLSLCSLILLLDSQHK